MAAATTIFGFNDFFYGYQILQFSKYLISIKHYRSLGISTQRFALVNPLASFIAYYTAQIAGSVFYNLCMGYPIMDVVANFKYFMICLIFWSLTFHCPKDLFYRFFGESIVGKILSVLRELERVISVAKISENVLAKDNSGVFSAFIVSLVTINLPYHLIYFNDQFLRGLTIKKHELLLKSFASRITVFICLTYNWYRYLPQFAGKYQHIDMILHLNNLQLLQLVAILTITLKISYIFGYDFLSFDESVLFCPLTKLSSIFKIKSTSVSMSTTTTRTRRRSVSNRHDDQVSTITTDDEITIVEHDTTVSETPKKRKTSRLHTTTKRK